MIVKTSVAEAVACSASTWEEYGSPNTAAFGVTVSRDQQAVWLGNPNGPQWALPS
jgi:hypothetical protein